MDMKRDEREGWEGGGGWWGWFFFKDTATTEIYTLSLHDALPIFENELKIILKTQVIWYSDCEQQVDNVSSKSSIPQFSEFISGRLGSGYPTRGSPFKSPRVPWSIDRKSTRLNSSHKPISYAVFCLKKKTK